VDTVLGLSVTATNVQTVLVEGRDGDGATLGHDEFAVFTDDVSPTRASEQVAEAVLSIASSDGHHLHSIGVTWSDDADLEASLLLDTLADMGLANVVAVQSPRAAEALARSIGRMIGYERTAVCVIEPGGSAILSLVDTLGGDVETFVSHDVENDDLLLDWLSAILGERDWHPEAMFVVGSVGGLDSLAGWLEQELGVPVFDPPEAELALAHGAALASASDPAPGVKAPRRRLPAAPVAMLIAGAVTFVASVSVAVSSQLLPPREAAVVTDTQETKSSAVAPEKPKAKPAKPAPAAPAPASAAPPPPPEAPPAPPVEQVPPPVDEAPPAPAPVYEAPPPAPVYEPPVVEAPAPAPVYEAPAPAPEVINPIAPPPPVVAPAVPQVPYEKPRLRDRILDKIPGLNRFAN
jgi:hypothetical protein